MATKRNHCCTAKLLLIVLVFTHYICSTSGTIGGYCRCYRCIIMKCQYQTKLIQYWLCCDTVVLCCTVLPVVLHRLWSGTTQISHPTSACYHCQYIISFIVIVLLASCFYITTSYPAYASDFFWILKSILSSNIVWRLLGCKSAW